VDMLTTKLICAASENWSSQSRKPSSA